jgi:hypothetical protein
MHLFLGMGGPKILLGGVSAVRGFGIRNESDAGPLVPMAFATTPDRFADLRSLARSVHLGSLRRAAHGLSREGVCCPTPSRTTSNRYPDPDAKSAPSTRDIPIGFGVPLPQLRAALFDVGSVWYREAHLSVSWMRTEGSAGAPSDQVPRGFLLYAGAMPLREKPEASMTPPQTVDSPVDSDAVTTTASGDDLDDSQWWVFDSSRVAEAAYDRKNDNLYVRFMRPQVGSVEYVYEGVPANVWRNFRRSQSPGKFINRVLNDYDYHRTSH